MSELLQDVSQQMQEFTSFMESRRLPSLRIQNRLRAPSQPVYEPLAHRTRRREKQESVEPTKEDLKLQQREDRAARAARREEALALEREKRVRKAEPNPPPPAPPVAPEPVMDEVPAIPEDPIDALINSVIHKAGEMLKAEKRKKRPKSTSQFYNDDTFLPVGDTKYLRVENLNGDVKAEIRKQMNQGRAARAEARGDPNSVVTAPEISLAAAITNVKQNHEEIIPQNIPQIKGDSFIENNKYDVMESLPPPRVNILSQVPRSMILPPSKSILTRLPPAPYATRPAVLSPIIRYRIQSNPAMNNEASSRVYQQHVSNIPQQQPMSSYSTGPYQQISGIPQQRRMFIRQSDSPSQRFIRVIRQPIRYVGNHNSYVIQTARPTTTNIPRPPPHPQSIMVVNSNGTMTSRPQPNFVRRVVPQNASRMTMQVNGSFRPSVYKQPNPNNFTSNRILSPNVIPINQTNGNESTSPSPSNGKTRENGTLPEEQQPIMMPTLKRFDGALINTEIPNGNAKAEVLSTNQTSNQSFN